MPSIITVKISYEYPINDSLSLDFKLKHTWLDSNLANSTMIHKNGYFRVYWDYLPLLGQRIVISRASF